MAYREELKEVLGESSSSGRGHGRQQGHAYGSGMGGTEAFFDGKETLESSQSWSRFASGSESENESWSEGPTHSKSLVPTLVPVFGKELSHVQFHSLEEQLFRAMAVLFDQKQRQGVARLVGVNAPVSLFTPEVKKMLGSPERTKQYIDRCCEKLPFALSSAQAQKQLADRAVSFTESLFKEVTREGEAIKRRVG